MFERGVSANRPFGYFNEIGGKSYWRRTGAWVSLNTIFWPYREISIGPFGYWFSHWKAETDLARMATHWKFQQRPRTPN